MSDRVKIVVEIPKEVFEARKVGEISPWVTTPILDSVRNGTPLSEELAEIKGEIAEIPKKYPMTKEYEYGLNEAMAIIDKHIIGEGDKEC